MARSSRCSSSHGTVTAFPALRSAIRRATSSSQASCTVSSVPSRLSSRVLANAARSSADKAKERFRRSEPSGLMLRILHLAQSKLRPIRYRYLGCLPLDDRGSSSGSVDSFLSRSAANSRFGLWDLWLPCLLPALVFEQAVQGGDYGESDQ